MKISNIRYLARVTIQTKKALSIGIGDKDLITDRLIAKDLSGLPYIPGTSIKGVLRNLFDQHSNNEELNSIFGFQDGEKGNGARIIISSAQFVGKDMEVFEGLTEPDWTDSFYNLFRNLPIRDHVRINDKGSAEKGAKFDEELVYKGTRFIFELELIGSDLDEKIWNQILNLLYQSDFRIGGGIWKGFGEIEIIDLKQRIYNLNNEADFNDYLQRSTSLSKDIAGMKSISEKTAQNDTYISYELHLKPDDFFLFGAGEGDDDADNIPVTEDYIAWDNDMPKIIEKALLLPGTSIKGAIAHRVAYHYNKHNKIFADDLDNADNLLRAALSNKFRLPVKFNSKSPADIRKLLSQHNPAVVGLFGTTLEKDFVNLVESDLKSAQRTGNVIVSDIYIESTERKLLNHVAIDRFTGGAVQGALFSEQVATIEDNTDVVLLIKVRNRNLSTSEKDRNETPFHLEYLEYLELALKDIATGMLPLGGGTMRGHGCFQGTIIKNGEKL